LDQQIEQLSALIANRITPAGAESPQQGSTAIAAMQTQRARFLAMRAELFRGLAEDLEFEAQNKSGDESLLLRAEARVLRRQGSVDIQRSVNDARSSAATVPSAANIAQWAWSHALVHAVHADRDAAVTYLDRARASGANVGYLEGVLARQQSQWEAAQLAFDHAAEGSEQREFSLIAAARTARSRGQTEQARSLAQRVLQTNALHDGALSVLQSISGPAQPTARAAVTPSGGLPASDTTLQPPTASTVAAQPSSYAALIAEGQRWMRRGEYQKARASYRQALAVQPDGVEARSGEAWLNLRMGSYQAAHTAFRELYAANRREHEYRAGLALSLEKLQRNDEAIREMRSYLGLAPWGMHSDEVRRRLAVLAPANPRR
jgi:tetratricopeptide (TPR) repeat protein